MNKKQLYRVLIWLFSVAIVQIPLLFWWEFHRNPLDKYGVAVDMFYSTDSIEANSFPYLYVYCFYKGKIITPNIAWGGIYNANLEFRDVDGDCIKAVSYTHLTLPTN